MKFTGNQAVKILNGEFKNGVASIIEANDETQKALINIFGLIDDLTVDATLWINYSDISGDVQQVIDLAEPATADLIKPVINLEAEPAAEAV